jgi:hypothetical protein
MDILPVGKFCKIVLYDAPIPTLTLKYHPYHLGGPFILKCNVVEYEYQ